MSYDSFVSVSNQSPTSNMLLIGARVLSEWKMSYDIFTKIFFKTREENMHTCTKILKNVLSDFCFCEYSGADYWHVSNRGPIVTETKMSYDIFQICFGTTRVENIHMRAKAALLLQNTWTTHVHVSRYCRMFKNVPIHV